MRRDVVVLVLVMVVLVVLVVLVVVLVVIKHGVERPTDHYAHGNQNPQWGDSLLYQGMMHSGTKCIVKDTVQSFKVHGGQ